MKEGVGMRVGCWVLGGGAGKGRAEERERVMCGRVAG